MSMKEVWARQDSAQGKAKVLAQEEKGPPSPQKSVSISNRFSLVQLQRHRS